jgi:hypothetical protein
VEALTGKDTSLESLCFALLELARIDIALMEADEGDRKSVSLIGVETAPLLPNGSPGRNGVTAGGTTLDHLFSPI